MNRTKFRGVFTALVCPFRADGAVDSDRFTALAERQIEAGIHGLVPCGTTGETPALKDAEWDALVRTAVAVARGRVPVIAGTGSNNTDTTVVRTLRAKELGADAALVVTPYYNKPNPAGLHAHYARIAAEGGLPVIVYNVPSRTGLDLRPEALLEIAAIPGIVGVKEASGRLVQALAILGARPAEAAVLSGEDDLACAMTLMGGDGVISVVSNVDPRGSVEMIEAALEGDAARARAAHFRLAPLIRALFLETNPVPAKAALELLGLASDRVRLPLAAASETTREALRAALDHAGVVA